MRHSSLLNVFNSYNLSNDFLINRLICVPNGKKISN